MGYNLDPPSEDNPNTSGLLPGTTYGPLDPVDESNDHAGALFTYSIAGSGSSALIAGVTEYTVSVDQRGQARDRPGDIGAYEFLAR